MRVPVLRTNVSAIRRWSRLSYIERRRNFDNIPVGIHILSAEGQILLVNAAEAKMLGYPKHMIRGRSFVDFIAPEQKDDALNRFRRKLNGERVEKKVDRIYIRSNGSRIFVTSEDRLIKDPLNNEKKILTALIDITELKELQEQIHELERGKEMRDLAAGYSHEFNTHLAIIQNAGVVIGNTLRQAGFSDPQISTLLDIIAESCREGTKLNRGIMSYARNMVDPFTVSELSLGDHVSRVIDLFKMTFCSRPVKVDRHIEEVLINGNAAELHSLMLNLMINARDAIPESREAKIQVKLNRVHLRKKLKTKGGVVLEPGDYARLSVADNGSGIPESIRGKIFTPFFSSKNPVENHGLGLSVIIGIVTRHRGGITFESREGKGTTFYIYFPLC